MSKEKEGGVSVKELERLANSPMSNIDIIKRLGGRTKILMYDEFNKYNDLEDVLRPWDNVVFLLRTEEDFGHWMCIKRAFDRISFFDSYGDFPDVQKKYVKTKFLEKSNQKYNKLCELLYNASFKYVIEFSQYKLQKKSEDISTCGQWCCLFIESGLLVDDFKTYIDSFKEQNKDYLCVKLFYDLI